MCTLLFSENVASVIDLGTKSKNDTVAHVFAVNFETNEEPCGRGWGRQLLEVVDSLTREIQPMHRKDAARV